MSYYKSLINVVQLQQQSLMVGQVIKMFPQHIISSQAQILYTYLVLLVLIMAKIQQDILV